MTSEQLAAQGDLAVGIVPILWKLEDTDPELAELGWDLLFDLIRKRLGDNRFGAVLYRYAEKKSIDVPKLNRYVNLLEGIERGSRGRAR
jgi:thiamine biosynthesis protein ThiC